MSLVEVFISALRQESRYSNMKCPNCSSEDIQTENKKQGFTYGEAEGRVNLVAEIPVRHCLSCDLKYEDADAFEARHNAVCDHLGLMRPTMIKELRKKTYRTREAFAAATGIGIASLARWESGAVIQSPAYDRYLRLLAYLEVRERLNILTSRPQESLEIHEERSAYKRQRITRFVGRGLTAEMMVKQEQSIAQFSLRGNVRLAGATR